MLWGKTLPERLLTQHFLQRFMENDLLSPDADHHDAIALVCGGLLTLGLFLSVFISLKFLFMPFPLPGLTAVLAMGDRLVFVTVPHLLTGRNTDLDLPTAFDAPAPGTTRLDLG
jgi:hypothetical protein